jgi:hypothetical protein
MHVRPVRLNGRLFRSDPVVTGGRGPSPDRRRCARQPCRDLPAFGRRPCFAGSQSSRFRGRLPPLICRRSPRGAASGRTVTVPHRATSCTRSLDSGRRRCCPLSLVDPSSSAAAAPPAVWPVPCWHGALATPATLPVFRLVADARFARGRCGIAACPRHYPDHYRADLAADRPLGRPRCSRHVSIRMTLSPGPDRTGWLRPDSPI